VKLRWFLNGAGFMIHPPWSQPGSVSSWQMDNLNSKQPLWVSFSSRCVSLGNRRMGQKVISKDSLLVFSKRPFILFRKSREFTDENFDRSQKSDFEIKNFFDQRRWLRNSSVISESTIHIGKGEISIEVPYDDIWFNCAITVEFRNHSSVLTHRHPRK
jgi:hypothetical protein